jgi:hypothetical protein
VAAVKVCGPERRARLPRFVQDRPGQRFWFGWGSGGFDFFGPDVETREFMFVCVVCVMPAAVINPVASPAMAWPYVTEKTLQNFPRRQP